MATTPTASSEPQLTLPSLPQQQSSWTDDLPVCNNSGASRADSRSGQTAPCLGNEEATGWWFVTVQTIHL